MTENTQILLVIWAFWLSVGLLDLLALLTVRRRAIPAAAAVLWVMWIVGVPILGAISFFLVNPRNAPRTSSSG